MQPKIKPKKMPERQPKALQSIKDQAFGFIRVKDAAICVNIELIWHEAEEDEQRFIEEFAKTYAHELLHIIMNKVIDNIKEIPVEEEEEVIRAMCGEKWDEEIEGLYKEKN